MDNLFPPGRGIFGGDSLRHPGNGQHGTANHPDMGSQCRRCPLDRCTVPAGAGGHASRLLHAQPQLDPLQPASLPMLATLRAGFWRHGGTLSCWLRVVNRFGFTFIRAPERFSFSPAVNRRWSADGTSCSAEEAQPPSDHAYKSFAINVRHWTNSQHGAGIIIKG